MTNSDPQDLLRLADSVEEDTGPDRELDIAIAIAVGDVPADYERGSMHGEPLMYFWHKADSHAALWSPERYTASLDAAMTLAGQHGFGLLGPMMGSGLWQANCGEDGEHQADAATPALALCAAALKARAHSTKDSSNG